MSAEDIVRFAHDELNVGLEAGKSREYLLFQLYRLGMVEEAA